MSIIYSKHDKMMFVILAIIMGMVIAGIIFWIYNKNVFDLQDGKELRDALAEVETFVGNRPWIPEWSEVVQKRAGIPIANLSFPMNSYSIPTKMIPYNMIIVDISSAMYLNGKGYVDPSTILLANEWKDLLGLLPAKIPYDYNKVVEQTKKEYENQRVSSFEQAKNASEDTNKNCSVMSIFISDKPSQESESDTSGKSKEPQKEFELPKPKYDPGYGDMLEWTIKKQQENAELYRQYGFDELPEFRYDYYKPSSKTGVTINWDDYEPIVQSIFNQIKDKYESATTDKMQCASVYDRCALRLIDWRLIKAGEHKKTRERIMEGQLLLTDVRQMYILVRFVATDSDIYTVYLEGYEYRSKWLLDNEKWLGIDNQVSPVLNGMNPVRINSNPMLGKYNASKGYLYSSSEIAEGIPQVTNEEARQMAQAKVLSMRDREQMFIPRCFGKLALTKSECEMEYKPDGSKEKTIGVWDAMCSRNEDCPFYKANKNYPNNFGGCNNGQCQMPLGVTQVSPTKYRDGDRAICHQCIEGGNVNCCKGQEDRSRYPNLKSPDYAFSSDASARRSYF